MLFLEIFFVGLAFKWSVIHALKSWNQAFHFFLVMENFSVLFVLPPEAIVGGIAIRAKVKQ